MRNIKVAIALSCCLVFGLSQADARVYLGSSDKAPTPNGKTAANCTPATAATELDINNTRALIQAGGDMWWDLVNSPRYEIPKGSGQTALYAGSLWLGGQDVSGQLKVAAQRFRSNGNDYWTGPLSTTNAEIDPQTCIQYDEHFVTTRQEVQTFVGWFACNNDPDCDTDIEYPGYSIPSSILDWPAHGRNFDPYNEDFYLAPFIDVNGDGVYNPLDGDYPGYDLKGEIDCSERIVSIFGDQNLWWVFNDKGNIHTETGSNAIGMEIRAQAFAFATNDEVNNMTFYNYELINRSTFTLTETYFGQWVDADLGNPQDDYVGCDVQRGLGYCYNGDDNDEDNSGATGYGTQPPAIGVDFFQGPFQDNDGIDNPLTEDYDLAVTALGIPYPGIGIGYGDGIVDNERFGMRKFLYHNNDGSPRGDPTTGVEYYNYLRSIWRDGTGMKYGGTGHVGNSNTDPNTDADYMFPGDTDEIGWGTGGVPQETWTEVTAENSPFDRRFMQSAGPFTLQPGALNNITVGVVWAQATSGGANASVEALRIADDKTQAMFDGCFRVLNGPDAPDLDFQELDRELVLYISNSALSNNANEEYSEKDAFQIPPDSLDGEPLTEEEKDNYNKYTFQGYQIYQVADASVAPNDLDDPDKARLVFQCDVRDGVSQIVNHNFDKELNGYVAVEEVDGADDGISHSVRISQDLFATGDRTLVNHKTYYYIGIAYAYNNFKTFDPTVPDGLTGQETPYLAGRKSATGGIRVYSAIPHKAEVESGGLIVNSSYGDQIPMTRIEGTGNGGNWLEMTDADRETAVEGPEYRVKNPTYLGGNAPVRIQIIDPLNVQGGDYTLAFKDTSFNTSSDSTSLGTLANGYWELTNEAGDVWAADRMIMTNDEQLIPELGISIQAIQNPNPGVQTELGNGSLGGQIEFSDPTLPWLSGMPDSDGAVPDNWIRSGTQRFDPQDSDPYDDYSYVVNGEDFFYDPNQDFESIIDGTWAPGCFGANHDNGPMPEVIDRSQIYQYLTSEPFPHSRYPMLKFLNSVDIVFTNDKSKWTRCPVVETADSSTYSPAGVERGYLRASPSVDKDGNYADTTAGPSTDPNSANYISPYGMGWFPGYAINIETGERLNMAFGEDSWLIDENGADMLWNPTDQTFEGPFNNIRLGGKHFIYVFRNNVVEDNLIDQGVPMDYNNPNFRQPAYDAGAWMIDRFLSASDKDMRDIYRSCMWIGFPLITPGQELLSTDAIVKLRVEKPYEGYGTGQWISEGQSLSIGTSYFVDKGPIMHDSVRYERGEFFTATSTSFSIDPTGAPPFNVSTEDTENVLVESINSGLPMYTFNLDDYVPTMNVNDVAVSMLDEIYAVPNPYYAYSQYETDKLDNRIKVINLPQTCTVSIYAADGTLVRRFQKDDPTITSIDWDLKNQAQVPISSGTYIIHVDVPDVGEKVIKWFGALRPVDLDTF